MAEAEDVIIELQGNLHHAVPLDDESQEDDEAHKKVKGYFYLLF